MRTVDELLGLPTAFRAWLQANPDAPISALNSRLCPVALWIEAETGTPTAVFGYSLYCPMPEGIIMTLDYEREPGYRRSPTWVRQFVTAFDNTYPRFGERPAEKAGRLLNQVLANVAVLP